ncbi:insulin-like growth factor-binding protein 7 isoform X4 [Nematostella vectensis]|uniref:insulin-like growth factor-binding protein 7 isoform X1 n=1 Tax=Nematostella vectensis TaxID=45351 RepID=UPI0020774D6C|nr:insulin-like growth factor-binding protein 7 isoform X1 [Nematostella vectensis]XP_048590166.1 insulin-like growth factor-binding protein 7 isoform X2 [Nematostella vectensis]XP_048590167.1 insulin-like growth factor-binding protein 7 isoform X3 [Nematostella vectensis]XP_048590168.1 insulin-like growth factor-binding protein 7 isoform X4 [Nematostella vectensis]
MSPFLVFSIICFSISSLDALSCLPCNMVKCRPVTQLRCRGGLVSDVCGCCKRCAKVEGDSCKGPWGIFGLCDKGLECDTSDFVGHSANAHGKCVKAKPSCSNKVCTSPPHSFCLMVDGEPKCICPAACPTDVTPKCGSDGKLYLNKCEMRRASCDQGRVITERPWENCTAPNEQD